MTPLRNAVDITGQPVTRDLRRARLLAARTRPIASVNRRAILSGSWDGGSVVGAYRDGRGSFTKPAPAEDGQP